MAAEVLKNTGLKIVHRLTAGDDRAILGTMMSANETQLEAVATYLPGDALVSYEGLVRPFKMKIAQFDLKDAPSTEKLYELMTARNLHKYIMQKTFAIRFEKLKESWIKEWRIAVEIFEQLQNDCEKIRAADTIKDYEILMNMIVKEQMGLDNCIAFLRKVVKKYKNTIDITFDQESEACDFCDHMKESIEKLIKNTKIILQKTKEGEI